MNKNRKKGFTLVELLVVIAILAILAVVSVVGYTSFLDKARKSNDISLTKQMNTILQAEEVDGEKNETAYEAVQQLEEGGLDVTKLTPTTDGYHYVYDIKQNRMFLLDSSKTKVAPTDAEPSSNAYLFAFVGSTTEIGNFSGYSYYLKSGFNFTDTTTQSIKKMAAVSSDKSLTISTGAGVDVGDNKNVKLTYTSPITENVVIRTTGDQATVTIKPSSAGSSTSTSSTGSVKFYGYAQTIAVDTSNSTTVSVSGACNELVVASGTIEVEETGVVFKAVVSSTSGAVSIQNNGYVSEAYTTSEAINVENTNSTDASNKLYDDSSDKLSANTNVVKGNSAGGSYKIATLTQLETFRDTVNAGASFEDQTVELTSDITLKDGWTPIGEGNRDIINGDVNSSGSFFKGKFDGKNHTIYNLNNKNYSPESKRVVNEKNGEKQYAYGLFALVEGSSTSNTEIKNVKLANVNIDSSRYTEANMDSVGALVGYIKGNVNISNVTTSGSIKAIDSVGGIIGRWYVVETDVDSTISNCVNYVNVVASKNVTSNGPKAAGILGYTNVKTSGNTGKLTFDNCTNNGNVTALNTVTKDEMWADSIALNDGAVDGRRELTIVLKNCTNNGTVTSGGDTRYLVAGNATGAIEDQTLEHKS